MIRRVLQEVLTFLLPFLIFGLYLALRGRRPHDRANWAGQGFRLTLAGLGLVILSLVATGLFSERHKGGYVPPHIENGQVVPGRFQ